MNKTQKTMDIERDFNDMIVKVLMDNGYWEYNRLGFGVDKDKNLFLVDLDDTGENERVMNFVKEGLDIETVLQIGVNCGVFEKFELEEGYNQEDTHRVIEQVEDEDSWNMFYKLVLVKEEFIA